MKTLILTALFASLALAQPPAGPRPQRNLAELKSYLNLTDAQVAALQALHKPPQAKDAEFRQQMQEKHAALDALLKANSTDAAAIGKAVLDIQALRKKSEASPDNPRVKAAAILTAEQKTKLQALEQAAKLRPVIEEATAFLLLTPPANAVGMFGQMGPRGRQDGPGGPGMQGRGGPQGPGGPQAMMRGQNCPGAQNQFRGPGGRRQQGPGFQRQGRPGGQQQQGPSAQPQGQGEQGQGPAGPPPPQAEGDDQAMMEGPMDLGPEAGGPEDPEAPSPSAPAALDKQ